MDLEKDKNGSKESNPDTPACCTGGKQGEGTQFSCCGGQSGESSGKMKTVSVIKKVIFYAVILAAILVALSSAFKKTKSESLVKGEKIVCPSDGSGNYDKPSSPGSCCPK